MSIDLRSIDETAHGRQESLPGRFPLMERIAKVFGIAAMGVVAACGGRSSLNLPNKPAVHTGTGGVENGGSGGAGAEGGVGGAGGAGGACDVGNVGAIYATYSNPSIFQPAHGHGTALHFTLAKPTVVNAKILQDTGSGPGTVLRTLVTNQAMDAGDHSVFWNGLDENAQSLPDGRVFFSIDNDQAGDCFVANYGSVFVDESDSIPGYHAAQWPGEPDCSELSIGVASTPPSGLIPAGTVDANFGCFTFSTGCQDVHLHTLKTNALGVGDYAYLTDETLKDGIVQISNFENNDPVTGKTVFKHLEYIISAYGTKVICVHSNVSFSAVPGSTFRFQITDAQSVDASDNPMTSLDQKEIKGLPATTPTMEIVEPQ